VFSGVAPFADTLDSAIYLSVVDRGLRPPRPEGVKFINHGLNDALWTLIGECWLQQPSNRPISGLVASRLAALKSKDHMPTLDARASQYHVEHHPVAEQALSPSREGHPNPILNQVPQRSTPGLSLSKRRIIKGMISKPTGFV
jgi:hypothetical protein